MSEPTSPKCVACGVDWFHHGGMEHFFATSSELSDARDEAMAGGASAAREWRRAEIAEADAALAWRRVTELQERCTQMLESQRDARLKHDRFVRDLRSYAELLPRPFGEHLSAIIDHKASADGGAPR